MKSLRIERTQSSSEAWRKGLAPGVAQKLLAKQLEGIFFFPQVRESWGGCCCRSRQRSREIEIMTYRNLCILARSESTAVYKKVISGLSSTLKMFWVMENCDKLIFLCLCVLWAIIQSVGLLTGRLSQTVIGLLNYSITSNEEGSEKQPLNTLDRAAVLTHKITLRRNLQTLAKVGFGANCDTNA